MNLLRLPRIWIKYGRYIDVSRPRERTAFQQPSSVRSEGVDCGWNSKKVAHMSGCIGAIMYSTHLSCQPLSPDSTNWTPLFQSPLMTLLCITFTGPALSFHSMIRMKLGERVLRNLCKLDLCYSRPVSLMSLLWKTQASPFLFSVPTI